MDSKLVSLENKYHNTWSNGTERYSKCFEKTFLDNFANWEVNIDHSEEKKW